MTPSPSEQSPSGLGGRDGPHWTEEEVEGRGPEGTEAGLSWVGTWSGRAAGAKTREPEPRWLQRLYFLKYIF